EIEVIFDDEEKTPGKELVEDLLAIVTSFAGKLYGARSHKKKRLVEAVKNALRDD
ncbi:IS607 family transposase, partial [Thermococcus sp. LS2]|nr:IS607 family transposase [Thermococcus sp. LS2]